jgi:IS5 family transposase
VPDATTLLRFRDRLGAERFAKIFNKIVASARKQHLINDRLHLVDATAIRAKVDTWRIRNAYGKSKESDDDNEPKDPDNKTDYIQKNSPDKDARIGHCSANKTVYGYKGYIQMDKDSELIVSTTIDPANNQEALHLKELVENEVAGNPKMLAADKAYDTNENHNYLESKNIVSGILKRRIRRKDSNGNYYFEHRQSQEQQSAIAKVRSSIEHKIAELKRWHYLRQARFLGLAKMKIQMLLSCMAVNVKRMVAIISQNVSPPCPQKAFHTCS